MPDWAVPLSDVRFDEGDVEAVAAAYRSGWLSQGPAVAAFESAFAASVGAAHAIAVASGTAALQLICAALRIGAGDEVVLPSLTFAATAAAVVHTGARPVFADIRGPHEPWLSPTAAAAALAPATRAIVNVGYAGHPGEVVALRALAENGGMLLIEDAAHALGARAGERYAGTFGAAGAFSFFANKNLALGEGGMVVTDDPELAERARLLRSHGLTSDTWARHRGDAVGYDVLEPGFNFRLDEPRAALGVRLLDRLAADNRRRAAHAARYGAALAGIDGVEPVLGLEEGVENAWHIYPVLLAPGVDRRQFRQSLREAGVQTSVHYPPLHLTSAFARPRAGNGDPVAPRPATEGDPVGPGPATASDPAGSLPTTEDYARRTVTIPIFPHLTESQQEQVLLAIAAALRRPS